MSKPSVHFSLSIILIMAWQICQATELHTRVKTQWDELEMRTEKSFQAYEQAQVQSWNNMEKRVLQKWADGALPEQKTFIEYFDDDTTRVKVDYDHGSVTVESLINSTAEGQSAEAAKQNIEKALSAILSLNKTSPSTIISVDEVTTSSSPKQEIISALASKATTIGSETGVDGVPRPLYRVSFNLVPDFVKRRAAKYEPLVNLWAQKYHLDSAFILAVMRQESAFNPRARSWVGALGLMQIYPPYAGREVFKIVKHKDQVPSEDFLFDPDNNVMMGATFIQILRDNYFADIKDKQIQNYLIICAYNWSAGRLRKAITKGRISVRAPASTVFDQLERITPAETKDYLKKVTQYSKEFGGSQ